MGGSPASSASDRVRREWLRRVDAEYRSAAIAQHLGLWLIQIGASADLVRLAQRAARDELVHASHARRVYAAAGGTGVPSIERESLALERRASDPLEHDVARTAVSVFCLGETLAVRLFAALRSRCTVKPARAALDRVLRDEVRHRDLGFLVLEALIAMRPDAKALVERELPAMVGAFVASYAPEDARDDDVMPSMDRAWGLMPPSEYARILAKALPHDHLPRFAELGIDAGPAVRAGIAALSKLT